MKLLPLQSASAPPATSTPTARSTPAAPPSPSGRKPSASAWLAPLARWRTLQRRFDQRRQRERLLLIAAAAALALVLADSLWLGAALKNFRAARSQQQLAQTTLQGLQAEVARLRSQDSRQAQARQSELSGWRQRVREGEAALRQHEDTLVGPDRMIGLLEHLLARHGQVRVRALRSLGRSDLLAPVGNTTAVAAASPPTNPAGVARSAGAADNETPTGLYRHGVELVLEGSFADLLSYLQAMEALPQRVLWGSMSLKVEQHPKSVLTLRVYTISRERHWLEI
jgi:MSHA biogenesis protein MshJ